MSKETLQAEIELLHKQLDAKQLELDAKYAERNKILRKEREVKSSPKVGNIEARFQEAEMDAMFENDLYGDENFDFI